MGKITSSISYKLSYNHPDFIFFTEISKENRLEINLYELNHNSNWLTLCYDSNKYHIEIRPRSNIFRVLNQIKGNFGT